MKNLYIKLLIFSILFLNVNVSAFASNGIDIAEFKRIKQVKTLFKHKPKKEAPKETPAEPEQAQNEDSGKKLLNFEEVPFNDNPIGDVIPDYEPGLFFDNDNPQKMEGLPVKHESVKKEKKKKKAKLFKRKNKNNEEIIEEQVQEAKIEEHTYINDSDTVYIKEVEIFGNNLLDDSFVKSHIESKAGAPYDRLSVSNDLKALYATGYFTRNLRALPLRIDNNSVKLRIIVEENPPVTGFGIIGNNSIATNDILNILGEYEGKPQNVLSINNAINQIQDMYSSRGYILARVSKVADDPDGYVNLIIDEGIIGDIIVEGNNKTKDFIVKRNIFLQPGSVYNENIMRADILRLMGTQAFKDVQRELKQDEETGLYDVYISLEEQRTGKISVGVGIDSASGFFGSVGFGENNFRGLGQKLNLNLLAGTGVLMNDSYVSHKANLQGEISFLEPMFKRNDQSLAIRGFGRYYGSYQVPLAIERRLGAEVTVARKFSTYKNLSGSISFGVEHVDLSEGNEQRMRLQYGARGIPWALRQKEMEDGLFAKITPSLIYDTRDTSVNARHGVLARLTLEENIGIGAKTFGKLHGTLKRFIPVGKKSSIVLTARGGGKVHGTVPEFAGFSLGGPYTLRGFNVSEVGVGDGYMLGSAEYRVPIPFIDKLTSNSFLNNIRIATFVDAGTLFKRSIGSVVYNKPGYAITAGIGLRVFIPGMGPVNLDYGIPLTNTHSVHRSGGFFTFGMGELY